MTTHLEISRQPQASLGDPGTMRRSARFWTGDPYLLSWDLFGVVWLCAEAALAPWYAYPNCQTGQLFGLVCWLSTCVRRSRSIC